MAHQLHYTSAPTGLSGRAGFQFVAASRGATVAVRQAASPYLAYRPPPSAPSRPSTVELRDFPVSFSYERVPAGLVLVRCAYLGADYSGRYGNFVGHAVVADPVELHGLRPIELWSSRLWADRPAVSTAVSTADGPAGASLPELTELPPGADTDPDAVLAWLDGRDTRTLLPDLIEAALATVDGRAGQVLLVAERTETVARWIAAISYSVPPDLVLDLSFVTYTADPDRARQHLVGTTTDAWPGGETEAQVFHLDAGGQATARRPPGRYAQAVAAAWQAGDLAAIDGLGELVSAVPRAQRETAVALAALCQGAELSDAESAEIALLLSGTADLPEWIWAGLADHLDARHGLDLVLAVHDIAVRAGRQRVADRAAPIAVILALPLRQERTRLRDTLVLGDRGRVAVAPTVSAALRAAEDLDDLAQVIIVAQRLGLPLDVSSLGSGASRAARAGRGSLEALLRLLPGVEHRTALLEGAVAGLAGADSTALDRLLTEPICDLLVDRDWTAAPRVGGRVLATYGWRHPTHRVAVTEALADLGDRDLLPNAEVDRHIGKVWRAPDPTIADCLRLIARRRGEPGSLGRRRIVVELTRRAFAGGNLASGEAHDLARWVCDLLGKDNTADPAVADAYAVLAVHRLAAGDLDNGCALLDRAYPKGTATVTGTVAGHAHRLFDEATPVRQAAVLSTLPSRGRLRRELVSRLLKGRGTTADARIAEVAVRLLLTGRPDDDLGARTARAARRPADLGHLRAVLGGRDRRLVSGLDKLLIQRRRSRLFTFLRPRLFNLRRGRADG